MFKKSKDKTSVKGSKFSNFKFGAMKQKKQMSIAKPKQKKQMTVATPSQKKTQTVARRPQKRQMAVPTPTQKSTRVFNSNEHQAQAKSVLAYAAGLTKSARADSAKREASLNARLREATRG